jgi:hypothetical protein
VQLTVQLYEQLQEVKAKLHEQIVISETHTQETFALRQELKKMQT